MQNWLNTSKQQKNEEVENMNKKVNKHQIWKQTKLKDVEISHHIFAISPLPFFSTRKRRELYLERLCSNGLRSKRFSSVTFAVFFILCGAQYWSTSA